MSRGALTAVVCGDALTSRLRRRSLRATGPSARRSDSPFGAGSTPAALGVLEFNSDGDLDLVAVNRDAPELTFLVGDTAAGFNSSPAITAPPARGAAAQRRRPISRSGI